MEPKDAVFSDEPLGSLFQQLVGDALTRQCIQVSAHTEHYLSALLLAFVHTDPERFSRALGPELLSASSLAPMGRYAKFKGAKRPRRRSSRASTAITARPISPCR